jgi:hypothetical protein
VADERSDDEDTIDTEMLLDRGERLLAQSARLIRRLDDALGRSEQDLRPTEATPADVIEHAGDDR